MLVLFVIFSLHSVNILQICFLIFSMVLVVTLQTASPSPLYSPVLVFNISLMSSQVSTPSELRIVTSNEFVVFLVHCSSL